MFNVRYSRKLGMRILGVCAAVLLLGLSGCSSGSTDTESEDSNADIFVAGNGAAGSITLSVNSTTLEVGDTSSFSVQVRDANGAAASQVSVSCDSENGVAIIEPSSGREITDSSGRISGTIGCTAPGSFQFACRLPVGGNLRQFVTVVCSGSTPNGFAGFPGAAGGGLGGGVSTVDDGDTGRVRITGISIIDDGSGTGDGQPQVDTAQGTCGTAPDLTAEPFFDSVVEVTVENNSNRAVRFTGLRYSFNDSDGAGTPFNSKELSLIGDTSALSANGDTTSFQVIWLKASGGAKQLLDGGFIPASLGVKNITFRLDGKDGDGNDFTVSGRIAVSFGNFNLCDE